MSFTSLPAFSSRVALTDLPVSRWPLILWGLSLVLAWLAIVNADLTVFWRIAVMLLTLLVAGAEWRTRVRVSALWFDSDRLVCQLSDGSLLEAEWPVPMALSPWWISVGFPAGWRRRWVAVYRDQLDADGFRRLRVMARNP
jgi:hypothetical protein